jgi:entericidin B
VFLSPYTGYTRPAAIAIGCFYTVNGESKMIKRFALTLGLMSVILLAGCNTMKGAGQDIQTGGEKLENKAEQEQRD